jgi:hypothetical protein
LLGPIATQVLTPLYGVLRSSWGYTPNIYVSWYRRKGKALENPLLVLFVKVPGTFGCPRIDSMGGREGKAYLLRRRRCAAREKRLPMVEGGASVCFC